MACYRGRWEWGGVGGGGVWTARGGLNPLLGLFGLWVQEVPAICPNMLIKGLTHVSLSSYGVNFRPMPSM